MRLALAQINSVVGDLDGNAAPGRRAARRGARRRAPTSCSSPSSPSPAIRPRTCCCGPAFIRAARRAVEEIAKATPRDHRARRRAAPRRRPLQRLLRARATARSARVYRKRYLPNYGVFDEDRYFAPGDDLLLLRFGDVARRADDLRGHLAAGPAGDRPRARRRAARREHLGLAVPRRQGPRARGDAAACARATTRASSRSATRSAARTS